VVVNRRIFLPLLLLACACQPPQEPLVSAAAPAQVPPSTAEAGNITFRGIDDSTVTLVNGGWEGQPWVEGGAARPRAGLADGFDVRGDMDGDGSDERVVLLWTSSGGSGTFDYLAVVARAPDGKAVNIATAPLGDRVKVQSARIEEGNLVLDVVQAGPNDAMCCPGQKVRRTFTLEGAVLNEVSSEDLGRVFPDPAEKVSE
jgi:hypothetical protein